MLKLLVVHTANLLQQSQVLAHEVAHAHVRGNLLQAASPGEGGCGVALQVPWGAPD